MSKAQAFRAARREVAVTGRPVTVCYGSDGNGRRTYYWFHGTADQATDETGFVKVIEEIRP